MDTFDGINVALNTDSESDEESILSEKDKAKHSRYRMIALDIASKIVRGKYASGDIIYGRSTIASKYGVSSETARRALSLLAEQGIVDIVKGRGVTVTSTYCAADFVRDFEKIDTVQTLKQSLLNSMARQMDEMDKMASVLDEFIASAEKFRELSSFVPYRQLIEAGSPCIGMTLGSSRFWQQTRATVVAVRRNNNLCLSPGPSEIFSEGDVIYFVGQPDCVELVRGFIAPKG